MLRTYKWRKNCKRAQFLVAPAATLLARLDGCVYTPPHNMHNLPPPFPSPGLSATPGWPRRPISRSGHGNGCAGYTLQHQGQDMHFPGYKHFPRAQHSRCWAILKICTSTTCSRPCREVVAKSDLLDLVMPRNRSMSADLPILHPHLPDGCFLIPFFPPVSNF